MSLRVAIQMDPIQNVDINQDCSFLMAHEAQERGYDVFYYHVDTLAMNNDDVTAKAHKIKVRKEHGNHVTLEPAQTLDLRRDVDIVLIRQDPPFNMRYISSTYILDKIKDDTLVINNPTAIREIPEKILISYFPGLMPPNLITSDHQQIKEFYEEHKKIVLKPLYGNGGEHIYFIDEQEPNFNVILEMFEQFFDEPIIAQKYLDNVKTTGDKRIIMLEDQAIGAFTRVSKSVEIRTNIYAGGVAEKTTLNDRDLEICTTIGPRLKEMGLVLTAIDIIGDYLTEINTTSPGGFHEINRLNDVMIEKQVWDGFEDRLKS